MARLGLGLAALGRPGYLNLGHGDDLGAERSPAALERRAHWVLDAAYEGGIRYFDAARSYGRAEEFLGSWLRERAPADVTVGSKWGYVYTAGWEVEADPPEVKAPRRRDVPPPVRGDSRQPRVSTLALSDPLGHSGERRAR